LAPKSRRRRFENDSAFLAAVGFLKMTRLFQKADQLLAMSRGNVITGLIFFRHSSGVSGSFQIKMTQKWINVVDTGSNKVPTMSF
jgi:hypothetical protein